MIIGASKTYAAAKGKKGAKHSSAPAGRPDPVTETAPGTLGFYTSGMDAAHLKGSLPEGTSLILPTFDIMRALSYQLNEKLAEILKEAGIPFAPPFDMKMNYPTNSVRIESDRDDADWISDILNGDPGIKNVIQTTIAIGSHVSRIEEELKLQRDYRAADIPESLVSKYSYLSSGEKQSHTFSLRYGGNGLEFLSDEKPWTIPT